MRNSTSYSENFRSIIEKLRVPNMVGYFLHPKDYSEIGEIFYGEGAGIGKRQMSDIKRIKSNTDVNQYLARQFKRLALYLRKGDLDKFNFLARLILKKSISFRQYGIDYVMPNYNKMRLSKQISFMKRVSKIILKESKNLEYKRVWIDKKPGDYARPLGVPTPEWRVYTHMITRILEIIAENKDLYSDNQHGGRPYRGVQTCLETLSKKINETKYIFEFDLKGYFDHINHEQMLAPFKKYFIYSQLMSFMKSKVKEYKLPPIEKDLAVERFLNAPDWPALNWDPTPVRRSVLTQDDLYRIAIEENLTAAQIAEIDVLEEEFEWEEVIEKSLEKRSIEQDYKKLMEPNAMNDYTQFVGNIRVKLEPITEESRGKGRDSWKDLNLENQGVPQGSSFGPMLASLILGSTMRYYNSLTYMDDGLIFTNNPSEPPRLRAKLKKFGVEIAEEKTHIRSTEELITNGIKYLGTRWKRLKALQRETTRSFFTVASETRKKVSRDLIPGTDSERLRLINELYDRGYITVSKYKLLKRALEETRMGQYLDSELISLSQKYKFFGRLLSEAFKPGATFESMQREIQKGIDLATSRIKHAEGSIAQSIYSRTRIQYMDEEGFIRTIEPSLNNISSLSTMITLQLWRMDLSRPIGLSYKNDVPTLFYRRRKKGVSVRYKDIINRKPKNGL